MLPLHSEVDRVVVGLTLAASFDLHQAGLFKFPDKFRNTGTAHSHVLSHAILARKAEIIVPRVAQEHRVCDFGANGQGWIPEDEIGYLREAAADHRIFRGQTDVLHDLPYWLHLC